MKTIYAIRDRLSNDLVGQGMYILFVFRTDTQAVRYFADAVLDEKSMLHKHAADFELIVLGQVADDGELLAGNQPNIIITGDTLLAAQTPQLVKES